MNPNKLERARELVKSANETLIYLDECKVVKNAIYKKKRLIILTETHLFYFSRYVELKKKLSLLKIGNICIDQNHIIIDFIQNLGDPYSIKIFLPKDWDNSKDNIITKLFFSIQHLLTNPEINRIGFTVDLQSYKTFTLKSCPSYYGTFCRLGASLENPLFKLEIFDDIRIRFLIFFHKKLVDFSLFTNQESTAKLLLEIFPLCPSFKYLSIKQFSDTNIYQFLDNYTEYFTTVENITINGSATDVNSFADFFKRMRENLNSKMVGLSFSNSSFSNNHLDILQRYLSARKIQALEFLNSFSDKTVFQYFLTNFLPSLNQISEFTSLSLEDIGNLNFNELYRVLPKTVKSLSVVNCNLSIDQVFNTLNADSKSGNNGLSVLNLSYNTFSNRPKTSISNITFNIPTFLTVIILDHVTFLYGVLNPFLNSLFRTINNDIDISLVHMISNEDDFGHLDITFQQLVADIKLNKTEMKFIRSLKWDYNPISTNFISFLKLQTSLLSLSISGCYCPDDCDGFDDFCDYLSNNRSLTKLVCRRFNQISLESLTVPLIEAVGRSKINFLDISNSRGGSKCYEVLKSLMSFRSSNEPISQDDRNLNEPVSPSKTTKMTTLRCLIYDGLRPNSKEQLLDFINFVDHDEFSCRCSFPIHDIEYLYRSGKINLGDVYRIIFHSRIKTPEDYLRPFTTFYKENQSRFPFYFKDECIDVHPFIPAGSNNNNEDESEDTYRAGNQFEHSENEEEIEMNPAAFFGSRMNEMPSIKDSSFSMKSEDEDDNIDSMSRSAITKSNSQEARKLDIQSLSKCRNSKSENIDEFPTPSKYLDVSLMFEEEEEVVDFSSDEKNEQIKEQQSSKSKNDKALQLQRAKNDTKLRKSLVQSDYDDYDDELNNKKQIQDKNKIKQKNKKNHSDYDDYDDFPIAKKNLSKPKNNNKNVNYDDYYDYDYSQEVKKQTIIKNKVNLSPSQTLEAKKPTNTSNKPKAAMNQKQPAIIINRINAIPNRNSNMGKLQVRNRPQLSIFARNQRPQVVRATTVVNKKPNLISWSDSSSSYYYSGYEEEEDGDNKNYCYSEKESKNNKDQISSQIKNDKNQQKNKMNQNNNSDEFEEEKSKQNNNNNLISGPPLLSIETDPNYNNMNIVTMSPDKKYEELKVLQTDSDSSYGSDGYYDE